MTEKEAIKEVKRWTSILLSAGAKCVSETAEAQDMAIKALEEVQQYRDIGTVSELQDLVIGINALADSQFSAADMAKLVNDMKSLYEYQQIGTPEECLAEVEKQKVKKIVRVKLRQSERGSEYRCPVCESDLIKTVFFNEDGTEPDEKISWCSGCGQKLDWSDEDEQSITDSVQHRYGLGDSGRAKDGDKAVG